MTLVKFEKYEGLGNDFVVVDERAGAVLASAAIPRLCDRHFGVGADGVLEVLPPSSADAVATMVVRNADGSRPEMCGNGLRCVAAHLARTMPDRTSAAGDDVRLVVDTDAGPRPCLVRGDDVTVSMGLARLDGPIEIAADPATDRRSFRFERVSMGNPHAVSFAPFETDEFLRHGLALATHPSFPEGANIELCTRRADGSIDVLVWERGVGPTLACGSGACAVAVVACREELAAFDEPIPVRLPGGTLHITVGRDFSVHMRGPARRVFAGEVDA